MKSRFSFVLLAVLSAPLAATFAADNHALPSGPQTDGAFQKVILESDKDVDGDGKIDDSIVDPMELSVAKDGRVFFIERSGKVNMWNPQTKTSKQVGKIDVFRGLEDGLLGITLDPNFLKNHWIYLYYARPETSTDANGKKAGENRVARFTLNGDSLDMSSEKILVRVATQREECCHSGGSLNFDSKGNLYLSAGDNTNPFASDGYDPIDERPGRSPWDAQKIERERKRSARQNSSRSPRGRWDDHDSKGKSVSSRNAGNPA
jgi:cytochrome c